MRIFQALFLLLPLTSAATTQTPEAVVVEGVRRFTESTPLNAAASEIHARLLPHLPESRCSPISRGYVGSWEVADNRLYLTSLRAVDCSSATEVPLGLLSPGAGGRIPAAWFSGELVFERGPRVEGPCGFSPTCPSGHDVLIFESGRMVGSEYRPLKR
jgi:hypothetical protein